MPTSDPGGTPAEGTPPAPPAADRRLAYASGALAVTAGLGVAAFLLAQTAAAPLSMHAFGLFGVWALSCACLGVGVCAEVHHDPRWARLLTCGLDYGNPRLDEVLLPEARRWRARPRPRLAIRWSAVTGWAYAAVYTYQIATGTYRVGFTLELITLLCLLTGAVWGTVMSVGACGDARRDRLYELCVARHATCRATDRRISEELARARYDTDTAERPLPDLRLVRGDAAAAQIPPGA